MIASLGVLIVVENLIVLLLLDEPTVAFSPAMVEQMVGLVKQLVAEQKMTVALIEAMRTSIFAGAPKCIACQLGALSRGGMKVHLIDEIGNRCTFDVRPGLGFGIIDAM